MKIIEKRRLENWREWSEFIAEEVDSFWWEHDFYPDKVIINEYTYHLINEYVNNKEGALENVESYENNKRVNTNSKEYIKLEKYQGCNFLIDFDVDDSLQDLEFCFVREPMFPALQVRLEQFLSNPITNN
jgi:hypothetical protein